MYLLDTAPIWMAMLIIVLLRIFDVSLNTLRMIAIFEGWIALAALLGFLEVIAWSVSASQVLTRVTSDPLLLIAYAVGFSLGNVVGLGIDRYFSLGSSMVRLISTQSSHELVSKLRVQGRRITTVQGEGRDGPRTIIYCACPKGEVNKIISEATAIDPTILYVVERITGTNLPGSGAGLRSRSFQVRP